MSKKIENTTWFDESLNRVIDSRKIIYTVCRDAMHCVPTNQFDPQSKNLASIIRGYKSSVKKYATINNIDFVWQPRFHDHIIRNDESFHRISEYIINNPLNWHFKNLGAQKL